MIGGERVLICRARREVRSLIERDSIINDMTEGPLFRQMILFSLPIIFGNILQSCYTMIDMMIVGHFVGANGLSAVGIGGILTNLFLGAALGGGVGGQILLSQQVGAKRSGQLCTSIGTFMTVMLILAAVLGAAGVGLTNWLLRIMNTPESVRLQTKSYYLICCCGILFIYGYNCISAVFRGLGESKLPLMLIVISSVSNIVFDYLFVGLFGMGVKGAAAATVSAQGGAFGVSVVMLYRRRRETGFDFHRKSFIPERKTAVAILKLSMPIILFGVLISSSSMFINSNVNEYGVSASAVDGVGNKINMVVTSIAMGLYTGSGTIVGQCFGAGNHQRIRKTFWLTELISFAVWIIIASLMVLFPREIFRLFTREESVLAMAGSYMRITVFTFLGISLASGPFALFEGVGNTNLEMVAGILESLVVKIALSVILGQILGLYGYWTGCAVAAFTTTIVGFVYYFSKRWTLRKPLLPVEDT